MQSALSTRQTESTVVNSPLDTIWQHVRSLAFDKLIPSKVKSSTYQSGQPGSVESVVVVEYNNQAKWTYRISTISEQDHYIQYELVEADPVVTVSSSTHTIRLQRVTDTNQTFILWSTQYSNDVTLEIIEDSKHKKLEAYTELKKVHGK